MKGISFVLFIAIILGLFYPAPAQLSKDAGFLEIEPISFYFHNQSYFNRLTLTSSPARMWYSFHPAQEKGEQKPLFVFFNGGPGSGTSEGLMSLNTGPMTLDTLNPDLENGGDRFVENPNSWTRMGNVLYIDARAAGFSYNMVENSQDLGVRYREFNAQNFNCFLDAADFVRLLLRFLAAHPGIQNNSVVIVGESYGGIRASVMLHMLLNYRDYGNGNTMYQDDRLVEEIQAHYDRVFPAYSGSLVPRGVIAQQFGHQVLIQPLLAGNHQNFVSGEMFESENSDIFKLALEVGREFTPCQVSQCQARSNALTFVDRIAERDVYNFSKPRDWQDGYFYNAAQVLEHSSQLNRVTGIDVKNIPFFFADARTDAYRIINTTRLESSWEKQTPIDRLKRPLEVDSFIPLEFQLMQQARIRIGDRVSSVGPGDLQQVFGVLNLWDRYFITSNTDAGSSFYHNVAVFRGYRIHPYDDIYGRLFLENLGHVRTFITNARYDLVIYSPAIPGTLARYNQILMSAVHHREPMAGEERAGRIVLTFNQGFFPDLSDQSTRVIRFPIYHTSGHAVTITQPGEFLQDVMSWMGKKSSLMIGEERDFY